MGGSNLINKDIVGALCLGWGVEWVGKVLKRQEERVQAKARTGKQAVKSCIFFFLGPLCGNVFVPLFGRSNFFFISFQHKNKPHVVTFARSHRVWGQLLPDRWGQAAATRRHPRGHNRVVNVTKIASECLSHVYR